MPRRSRLYASEPITASERQVLNGRVLRLLPGLPSAVHAQFVDRLADAVAHAKPSLDLIKASDRDRRLNRQSAKGTVTRTSKLPLEGLAATLRPQTWPDSRGRPSDTWKHVLWRDVQDALVDAGVRRGNSWKTDFETTLTRVYRACASVAGAPQKGGLRRMYENGKRISVLRLVGPPRTAVRPQSKKQK
jgi:hypothetical protein